MNYTDDLIINENTLPVISQLAERIPGGFFIYHADGDQELIYFNTHLVSIFGCESAEEFRKLTGNSFRGIVHADDYIDNESDILAQIQKSDKNLDHVRYRFTRKDGSVGVMDDYGHFSRSESFGDIYYVFAQDITEQYREEREREENTARIMALDDTFGCLYDMELETGRYLTYVNNHLLDERDAEAMVYSDDFFGDTLKNTDLVIYPDDREGLIKVLNRDFIRETLSRENFYDFYYRLITDNGPRWARLRFVYKDREKTHVIVGAFNAEKEMAAKELAEQTRKEIIAKVAGTESTYIVYPDSDSFTVLSQNEYLSKNYHTDESFSESMERYAENDVFEQDRNAAREVLNLNYLVSRLEEEDEAVFRFRDISTGTPLWYEMRAVRLSGSEILLSFSDKDREVMEQLMFNRMRENYFGLYYVNVDAGLAWIIQTAHPELTGEAGTTVPYTALIKNIASLYDGETAEFLNKIGDIGYVREYFTENDSGYRTYKSTLFENRWIATSGLVLVKNGDGTPSACSLGFSLLDRDAGEKEEARLKLIETKEKLDREKLRNDILHDIIRSGKWAFYVNADDEIIGGDVSDEANTLIRNDVPPDGRSWLAIVHPDDREYAEEAFNAVIEDHSCATPYDVNYRMLSRDGEYRWFRSAGRMVRQEDGSGEFFGIHVDITEQMEQQQKHFLGAVPLSSDILLKANIGLWAFELDEGSEPRMYVDEAMLGLLGLAEQLPPEQTYHAWYDHIDADSYGLVAEAVEKMSSGEQSEVQYPWHHPDGHTMIVRCGGVRNFGYTKGIRIEGTHQDVTETLHYDEKVARHQQLELEASQVRADMLAFISDHEPDVDMFMEFFGRRVIEVTGCDQFIFRDTEGHRIVVNADGIEDIPQDICSQCAFSKFRDKRYGEKGVVLMNDCAKGCRGVMTHPDCPAKSSYMQKVFSDDRLAGLLTVHYLRDYHEFTENDTDIMKTVAAHLGLLLMRIAAKKSEMEKLKAESASAAKTQFLFNMSHDIRTPMNAILGYTDIGLKHVADIDRSRENYNKIKVAGGHLLNLINDILEMSRIESGTMELAENPMDIRESVEGIAQMGKALAIPKSIDFATEFGDMSNPYILSDELHINEVVINLISNAIKYTRPGGTVRFSVGQVSGVTDGKVTYRFEVSDNGIGMSEEFQKHLFEAFSREQTSTVSKQEGAGLGLSIVKKIIDLAGGTISVRSKPDEGSVFTVELPFRVMGADAVETFIAENRPPEEIAEDFVLEGKKVLLVEDNEMNREIATEILTEAGLEVDTAEDGEFAVSAVLNKGAGYYDFILMDIQMPVMNGYEATKAIRALPKGETVPIIALSANAFEEDRKKSIANGMNAHVAKPIDVGILLETMRGLIQ